MEGPTRKRRPTPGAPFAICWTNLPDQKPLLDPELLAELERLANLSPEELIAESDAQGIDENQARKMVEHAIAQADGLEKLVADENLERMAKMTAEQVQDEIGRAGLDPRQVGQIVQTALAERGR